MKGIIKEIVILLLLLIAIFLILIIIFYDYMPISVTVPENVQAYNTPDEVSEVAQEDIVGYEKQEVSVEITSSYLTKLKESGNFVSGKKNPFIPYYDDTYRPDEDSADIKVQEALDTGTIHQDDEEGEDDIGDTGDSGEKNENKKTTNKKESATIDTKIK